MLIYTLCWYSLWSHKLQPDWGIRGTSLHKSGPGVMLSYVGQMMIHHAHRNSHPFLFISVFLSFSYAILSCSLPAHTCPFSKFHSNLHPLSHTPSLITNLMSIWVEEEEVCQFIFLYRWIWGWSSGHVQKRCRKWKNWGMSVCDKKTKGKTELDCHFLSCESIPMSGWVLQILLNEFTVHSTTMTV